MASIVRLYLDHPLGPSQRLDLSRDNAHYLFGVMRLNVGDRVDVFNGVDGAWHTNVVSAGKRGGELECVAKVQQQVNPPDVWLLFAPIKKSRTDFIVEKATEMGAARIVPIQTDHTNSDRIKQDRLQAHAVEAAEQCAGTYVPAVDALTKLSSLLDSWPSDRRLLFCDENLAGGAFPKELPPGPWAIVIGPEGGFSEAERRRLGSLPQATAVALGPRILRADTAAVAALALWQDRIGDWS